MRRRPGTLARPAGFSTRWWTPLRGGALVAALAVGCSGDGAEGRRPAPGDASSGGTFPDTVRGVVTLLEAGGATFRRCGDAVEYWVIEEPGADLSVAARGLAGEEAPLYAELQAETVPAPQAGAGSGYEGALRVRRWVYLAEEASGCGRLEGRAGGEEPAAERGGALPAGVAWRAQGNEPFWMAEVRAERIVVVRPGVDTVSVPLVEPATDGAGRTWSAETEAHRLELRLEEAPCTDSMSGFAFSHTARLALDGTEYTGCARPGPAAGVVAGGGPE